MGKVVSIFERETDFLLNASPDRAARLVADMPRRLRLPTLAWMRGDDVSGLVSRRTWFRIVRDLREYGLDVSEPRRAGVEGQAERDLQAMLDRLPRFELQIVSRPSWYDLDVPIVEPVVEGAHDSADCGEPGYVEMALRTARALDARRVA